MVLARADWEVSNQVFGDLISQNSRHVILPRNMKAHPPRCNCYKNVVVLLASVLQRTCIGALHIKAVDMICSIISMTDRA